MSEPKPFGTMSLLKSIAIVLIGCAVGVAVRFLVSATAVENYPLGTLGTNVIGALVVGIVIGYVAKSILSSELKILTTTGFCTGFSIYSTFTRDAIGALDIGNMIIAALYVTISICIGIIAVCIGLQLKKR